MEPTQAILIIDDNPIVIRVLMSLVEGQATVYFAKHGEDGKIRDASGPGCAARGLPA